MKQKARSRELSPVGTLKKRRRQKEVDLLQCQQLTGLWNSLQSNIRKITSIATCSLKKTLFEYFISSYRDIEHFSIWIVCHFHI